MPLPEKSERNEKILILLDNGEKFVDVAEKFKISPSRARQIYYREKFRQLESITLKKFNCGG